jgi:alpha-ribazole phosphatase/probable phosphoglycerate mutase
MNLPIVYDSRLRERNLGTLQGKSWLDMDLAMSDKDHNQQYDYRPFGGEAVEDVRRRLMDCISDIQKKSKDKKVLIVTHAGNIRLLHHTLKGKVPERIHNASVHEFEFPDNN